MRTVGVGGLATVAVVAVSFLALAAGLPRPARADTAAARAAEWLLGYRYVTSTLHVSGRTVHARCFHGWFGGAARHAERGTLLQLSDGGSVRLLARTSRPVGYAIGSIAPSRLLAVAGCTDYLGPRLANAATAGDVHARHVELHERLVLALRYADTSVLVSPRDDEPLAVRVAGMASDIRLMRLHAGTLHALEAAR
ncbi:MAG TPA: hypothetical protein VFA56_03840 [Gaiellaceae bacterium]|nr:hypothetical protein [Gaiellaceae bacterium]